MVVVNGKTSTVISPTSTGGQPVGGYIISGIGGGTGNGTATASAAMFTGGSDGRKALNLFGLIWYMGPLACIQLFF